MTEWAVDIIVNVGLKDSSSGTSLRSEAREIDRESLVHIQIHVDPDMGA